MKKNLIGFLGLAILLAGCAASGITASGHVTSVQLTSPNFRVIATNVAGDATSTGALGVSFGIGMGATQLALIPLTDDRMLYRRAIEQLWSNFEAKNGPVAGRRLALVNVRYDSESVNLVLYTRLTTMVVADVIEFQ